MRARQAVEHGVNTLSVVVDLCYVAFGVVGVIAAVEGYGKFGYLGIPLAIYGLYCVSTFFPSSRGVTPEQAVAWHEHQQEAAQLGLSPGELVDYGETGSTCINKRCQYYGLDVPDGWCPGCGEKAGRY